MGQASGTKFRKSKSGEVAERLKVEHNLDLVDEMIAIYATQKQVYFHIAKKIAKNIDADTGQAPVDPMLGLTPTEISLYGSSRKDLLDILTGLFGYTYPKLRSLIEKGSGLGDIKFFINIGDAPAPGVLPLRSGTLALGHDPEDVSDAEFEEKDEDD